MSFSMYVDGMHKTTTMWRDLYGDKVSTSHESGNIESKQTVKTNNSWDKEFDAFE